MSYLLHRHYKKLFYFIQINLIDTDSIILECPRGKCPIPAGGAFLGEMAREFPDSEILELICAGPKQYALKLQNKKSGEVLYAMKHRGITVNVKNENSMSYDKFKELVFEAYGFSEDTDTPNPMFKYSRIGPDKSSSMLTREVSKIYRCVNTKGYCESGLIFPFGY